MKAKLQSGYSYSLSDLFRNEMKIIIPDLQRDYTWGDKKHGEDGKHELVSDFCNNLFDTHTDVSKKNNKELQLGMIYAYENPINHINLADGQQRITTLFLLMGILLRKTKDENIKKLLMSDFELNDDDQEPYLQYSIRESTLYFLSDLTVNYFINKQENEIKKSNWYFSEYDNDPSIQSMIKAIESIENIIEGKDSNDLFDFSGWLIKDVKFFYFDMINRQHGEEMFVVINTTGEPLTATENLKPLIIGNIKDVKERQNTSDIWEKWEKWFWQHKLNEEHEADPGLNQFFIWYWQIKLRQESDWSSGKQENLNPIKLFKEKPFHKKNNDDSEFSVISDNDWNKAKTVTGVDEYFKQFTILSNYFNDNTFLNIFKQINNRASNQRNFTIEQALNIILPMLEYMVKFPNSKEQHYVFLRKLRKNFFDNKWQERNINYVDWRHILEIIKKCTYSSDVLVYTGAYEGFKKIANVNSNIKNWYNKTDLIQNELKINNKSKIESWEDHKDFMGDLSFLFTVNNDFNSFNNKEKIEHLEKYYNNYTITVDMTGNKDEKDYKTSNLFRLFRLYIGCNKVGHIDYASWSFEGVLFSTLNREHLKKDTFKNLCISDDVNKYMIKYIKENVTEWNLFDIKEDSFSTDKFIKAWLTLKVFYAYNTLRKLCQEFN